MTRAFLGPVSGVGLVAATMIGAGVLLSAGYMAQDLTAGQILAAWGVGLVMALLGARAYAELAVVSGRSGGEYRFLSDYVHPFFGTFAGWASVLVGFAAPLAIDAYAAMAFLDRVVPLGSPGALRLGGALLILILAVAHGAHLGSSRLVQDALVVLKVVFVLGVAAVGLLLGAHTWPTWTPPNAREGFPWGPFLASQLWVAYAFTGWNAAGYVAAEFRSRRDVVVAMLVGCALVGVAYLALNATFVLNLPPERAFAVADSERTRVTLAHLVMEDVVGPIGAALSSALAVVVFVSAASALVLVGPRIVAEMAGDGVLPRWLGPREGRPPTGAVALQAGVAVVLLYTQAVLDLITSASAVLMAISAVTTLILPLLAWRGVEVRPVAVVSGVAYAVAVVAVLAAGLVTVPTVGWSIGGLLVISAVSHALARRPRTRSRGTASE